MNYSPTLSFIYFNSSNPTPFIYFRKVPKALWGLIHGRHYRDYVSRAGGTTTIFKRSLYANVELSLLGPLPRQMVTFNARLSQISRKVFLTN